MSASPPERELAQRIAEALDPRALPEVLAAYGRADPHRPLPPPEASVVLVGHRASGKSRILPMVAQLLRRRAVDLDAEISRRAGRELREWVAADPRGFREAERETFASLPPGLVVAAGGGFLALHADLLLGHVAVLVPVSFETYRERLLADASRPRLRPELSLEDEIRSVYEERERLHAERRPLPLAQLLRSAVGE